MYSLPLTQIVGPLTRHRSMTFGGRRGGETFVGEIRGKGRNSAKGGGYKQTGGGGSVNGTLNFKLTLLSPSFSLTQALHRSVKYQIKLKKLS